jgi:hypothetical protein
MFDFAETTKDMTSAEILNYYRNLYYAEPQVTERGIVANAINDYFADVVPKSEVEKLKTENLILKQKRLTLFDRLEFVKKGRADGAIEVIEYLENEGLLNMTPQGISELKKKYTEEKHEN